MRLKRRGRRLALGTVLLGFACGGGGGGGTGPCTPGAATQLVKTSGDPAPWYINNPLPAVLSVTARDANNCAVPGVVVNWAVASGGGAVTGQGPTNANGVATATDSLGSSTSQSVTATFTGLSSPVTFTATASAPPTSGAVSVVNNSFDPNSSVVKAGSTVTWTWNSGGVEHTLTFTSGPPPLPGQTDQTSGTKAIQFNVVGKYAYHCIIHGGMDGTLTVVN
jgi:plastocyanin